MRVNFCPKCGAKCEKKDIYCPKCGKNLRERNSKRKMTAEELWSEPATHGIIAFVLSFASLLLCAAGKIWTDKAFGLSLAGMIMAIIILIASSKIRRQIPENAHIRGFAVAAYAISIISLLISIVVVFCNGVIAMAGGIIGSCEGCLNGACQFIDGETVNQPITPESFMWFK